jgi:hypothetical protein
MIAVFSTRPVPRNYKEDNWGNQVNSVQESVKKELVGRGLPFREDLSAEPEEAVTRERLVKAQQAVKRLRVWCGGF